MSDDTSNWSTELDKQVVDYEAIRLATLPSIDKITNDPLSALNDNNDDNDKSWQAYYKDIELCNFINVDLDRLYMTGIDDDYFQTPRRREIIQNVLLIWAIQNRRTSYRQGMHEIVGPVLMCLEQELAQWNKEMQYHEVHPLRTSFNDKSLEAHTYWIFSRIMNDLEPIYDPNPTSNGKDSQPAVVLFCVKIQEHYLRELDPDLCSHLEENYIPAQLYGIRWSRLMLGREFPMTHEHCLRIWDYMFATCRSQVNVDAPAEFRADAGLTPQESIALRSRYGPYTPLLAALGDFILAMLLQIREKLAECDSTGCMGLLMRYPGMDDITPILDLADMIRRGVLNTGAHIQASTEEVNKKPANSNTSSNNNNNNNNLSMNMKKPNPPAWLAHANKILPNAKNAIQNIKENVGKHVSQVSERVSDSIGKVKEHLAQSNLNTPKMQESSSKARTNVDPLLGGAIAITKKQKSIVVKDIVDDDDDNLNESLMEGINVDEIVREDFTDIKSNDNVWYTNIPATNYYDDSSRRSSAGMDLSLMMSSQKKDTTTDPNFFSPPAVSQSLDNNNGVGDRLLDIADFLVRDNSSIIDVPEEEIRKSAARRLRILADCLAGLISIAEYDSKFSDMTINVSKSEVASVLSKVANNNNTINPTPTPRKGGSGSLYNLSIPESATKRNNNDSDPLKILFN